MAAQLRIPIAGLISLPKAASSVLHKPKSLFEVISRLPNDGLGQRVTQARWGHKGIENSYYTITKARLRANGTTGDVRGAFVWKGKLISKEQKIRGGHKHAWKHLPPPEQLVERQ
ncbi:hypothetical protein FS749_010480 [Ceratobasidium sp. UAMH 11750]|nr:hypothetical protein FS749_010480 [Ceratobasidium sp. UAMH 11750]